MAREFSRTERVADHLKRQLAVLIQRELRDPRIGFVSVTGVELSRDLSHARVFYTRIDCETAEDARDTTAALNHAAGFMRSELARESTMRSVPRFQFRFDASVGRGRQLEALIAKASAEDRHRHGEDDGS